MKAKKFLAFWAVISAMIFILIGAVVYSVDPFFHFHKPHTDKYFYPLDNQRSQNDGICRHFDYDAVIVGTSMTENFRTSEMDELFGCRSIKIPLNGAYYQEINATIERSIKYNPNVKTVVRCIDMTPMYYLSEEDVRDDLGVYPMYLYDDNFLNDANYLLNRDVLFSRAIPMMIGGGEGITSFDDYSRWSEKMIYGTRLLGRDWMTVSPAEEYTHLSEEEKKLIEENVYHYITKTADENKQVTFYYYFCPYSIAWWSYLYECGDMYKQFEAEKLMAELIVGHDNIHLFSFNNRKDIIADMNNYVDDIHYGGWINSLVLKCMSGDEYRITEENLDEFYEKEKEWITGFDYSSLNDQSDYEDDSYAAALFYEETYGHR